MTTLFSTPEQKIGKQNCVFADPSARTQLLSLTSCVYFLNTPYFAEMKVKEGVLKLGEKRRLVYDSFTNKKNKTFLSQIILYDVYKFLKLQTKITLVD